MTERIIDAIRTYWYGEQHTIEQRLAFYNVNPETVHNLTK